MAKFLYIINIKAIIIFYTYFNSKTFQMGVYLTLLACLSSY